MVRLALQSMDNALSSEVEGKTTQDKVGKLLSNRFLTLDFLFSWTKLHATWKYH